MNAKLSATRGLPAGEAAKERFYAARFDETRNDDEGEQAGRNDHHAKKHEKNVGYHRAISCVPFERAQRTTVI
ncbi:MAG: hypothetical protein E6G04_04280 [Actinobacteria bacterium]|nr:MAG: hypothetical protein E6G04_04280 [Actinomycetota bacterium]